MGTVWSALRLGEAGMINPCAIKVLHPMLAVTAEDRERFLNEARISAQLDHSRIVKVTDTSIVHDCPCIVMEWVDGVDLHDFLDRIGEQLQLDVCLYIVGEILDALEYAHERTIGGNDAGVIHYDIKPSNIMMSSSGEVKLTDFGIARFAAACESTLSHSVGTPRYMSPEQMSGRGRRESDIYSLGVVLHELLAGERYLPKLDNHQFQMAVLAGHVAELERSDIPAWLEQLRRQMLHTDAAQRPRAADARALILRQTSFYHIGARKLRELYEQHIGERRSGLTDVLDLDGLDDYILHIAKGTGRSMGSRSEGARSKSVGERLASVSGSYIPVGADTVPDDVPVRRRKAREPKPERTETEAPPHLELPEVAEPPLVREASPTSAAEVESADEQPIEPTVRLTPSFHGTLLGLGVLPVAAAHTATEDAAPEDVPVSREALASSVPMAQAATGSVSDTSGAVRVGRGWLIVAWVGVSVLAVGLGLTAWQLRVARRATPEPVVAELASSTGAGSLASTPDGAPEPTLARAALSEPVLLEPEPPRHAEAVDPQSRRTEIEDTPPGDAEELPPALEPTPETAPQEPKPEPKPKPKPAPRRRVFTAFQIAQSGVVTGVVEVGAHRLDYRYAASVDLAPGKYKVRWRAEAGDEWHEVGSIRIKPLPSGEYYQVKLTGSAAIVRAREEGSTK